MLRFTQAAPKVGHHDRTASKLISSSFGRSFTARHDANLDRRVVAIGGLVEDLVFRPTASLAGGLLLGTSVPGKVERSFGGVARNVAEAYARIEVSHAKGINGPPRRPLLAAVVGRGGKLAAAAHCEEVGIDPSLFLSGGDENSGTPTYAAMLDGKGDLVAAVSW